MLNKSAKAADRYQSRPADLYLLQVPGFDEFVNLGPANADHPAGFANAN
jgi:hypothetical protein